MASPSTINSWLEELGQSLIPTEGLPTKKPTRKLIDTFRRRVRHHTFVRTNQFDVEERLTGLEEKFQVLARDDLSDALYEHRVELREYEQHWIPDVLDLLLRLSRDPISATLVRDLQNFDAHASNSPQLHWSGVPPEDSIGSEDQIWKKPVFSDLSSDEDSVESPAESTSRASIEEASKSPFVDVQKKLPEPFEDSVPDTRNELSKALPQNLGESVTEIQLIRECLFMLHGYPTDLFVETNGHLKLRNQVRLQGVNPSAIQGLLSQLLVVRRKIEIVRRWSQEKSSVVYMQVIKRELSEIVAVYFSWINKYIDLLLHPRMTTAASVLQMVSEAEDNAKVLSFASDLVQSFSGAEPVKCLDLLYEAVCQTHLFETETVVHGVSRVFIRVLDVYISPLSTWLHEGRLEKDTSAFFVQADSAKADASNLWQEWYHLVVDGPARAPAFLSTYGNDILECGKTSAFLRLVAQDSALDTTGTVVDTFDSFKDSVRRAADDPSRLFPAAFNELLGNYFQTILHSGTAALKKVLDSQCGLERNLEAIEHLYLRRNGVMMDNIESKIFLRIDHCIDTWNDRFLVADMLEEHMSIHTSVDIGAIMVHSAHTSSRSMENRRQSVRILSALVVEYQLPWPVANIIPKESMASYRRIALVLAQIRRAKYILERVAYIRLQQYPISEYATDQKYAQLIVFMFLQFVNTMYDHFTANIITPMTCQMRRDFKLALTIDQMIALHATYITKLESACLVARQVNLLKDTLIGLLDMCIRLADLICSPSNAQRKASDDLEASSFISAQSRRRRRWRKATLANEDDDDSDDDDESGEEDNAEGYSTFVVLEEDAQIVEEIKKSESQFRRQLDFFVAGLRGVGKSGETMDEFEVLAGRLEWKKTTSTW